MASIYEDMRDVSREVLKEFDQSVYSFVKLTPGSGDPQNPGKPTRSKPVKLNGAIGRSPETKYVDGTNITTEHLQVVFAPQKGIEPTLRDFIDVDGEQFKIVAIRNVPPYGTVVAHKVFVQN